MIKAILGIDISKLTFDVALHCKDKWYCRKFDNNPKGFSALENWLKKKNISILHACMEATGVYGDALAHFLSDQGYQVSVVNPAQIKGFSQSELVRTKNDQLDAKLIARFCKAMSPALWEPIPRHIRELQAWVKRLDALIVMHRQEENRLEVADKALKPQVQESVDFLKEKITETRNKIKSHIDNNPDLKGKKKLLETIPGVGEATVGHILAFIGEPEKFESAKQVAAFIGLNPKQRQSGTSVRGKSSISKTGSANLRKAFYMPAIVAKRFNPIIQAFCERLEAKGKSKMTSICAAMRKLVHIIYGVLKSGKPFESRVAT